MNKKITVEFIVPDDMVFNIEQLIEAFYCSERYYPFKDGSCREVVYEPVFGESPTILIRRSNIVD